MTHVRELKTSVARSTPAFVLLSIVTLHIYQIVWFSKVYPLVDELTGRRTGSGGYVIWLTMCLVSLIAVAAFAGTDSAASLVTAWALWISMVVWAFRARRALKDHILTKYGIRFPMGAAWTVLIPFFYVNYSINRLPEVVP